ncbi:MAG: serine hydrolase [Alistipes sp.]|nr:serine hydrolase [Alistipes sp.]
MLTKINFDMTTIIKRSLILLLFAMLSLPLMAQQKNKSANDAAADKSLPRAEYSAPINKAVDDFLAATEKAKQEIHSIMVVQNGKVVAERWLNGAAADVPHVLNSVSKTFTATAVGIALAEGRFSLSDKVISFFPDKLPAEVSENLRKMEVRHLLSMSTGHDYAPDRHKMGADADWIKGFYAEPVLHEPGTFFVYNSLATYMLSAIVQKTTGEKVVDYLRPRLFEPLGIEDARWEECSQGINVGGWGLYLKTEDLAKLGQMILQKGKWNGKRIVPAKWIKEATKAHIASRPAGVRPENVKVKPEDSDWLQGYCYQMWRCRHNAVRADGAAGQYIIIMPDQNAVIAVTANLSNMQREISFIWEHILPVLK